MGVETDYIAACKKAITLKPTGKTAGLACEAIRRLRGKGKV